MPSPHAAEHIRQLVEEILDECKLPHDKISVILTDSGSNMVAAFRRRVEVVEGESGADEHEEEEEEEQEDDDDGGLVDIEVDDFERKELDHEVTFLSFNRLSCFAHLLQLVVRKFDGVSSYKALLQRVHSLLKCANMSTKATETCIPMQ